MSRSLKRSVLGMSEIAEKLKATLSQLPIEDRAALAHFLIQSLDEEEDSEAEAAWDAELERRFAEIESGQAVGEPVEQVMARLRAKYS
jgi:putative addiction module component (TIGR02574 family)